MRQVGVIRDKQAFPAAEVAREEYFFGPSPGMFLFIQCLSRMTSEITHGSLITARSRTLLFRKISQLVESLDQPCKPTQSSKEKIYIFFVLFSQRSVEDLEEKNLH